MEEICPKTNKKKTQNMNLNAKLNFKTSFVKA